MKVAKFLLVLTLSLFCYLGSLYISTYFATQAEFSFHSKLTASIQDQNTDSLGNDLDGRLKQVKILSNKYGIDKIHEYTGYCVIVIAVILLFGSLMSTYITLDISMVLMFPFVVHSFSIEVSQARYLFAGILIGLFCIWLIQRKKM